MYIYLKRKEWKMKTLLIFAPTEHLYQMPMTKGFCCVAYKPDRLNLAQNHF